MPAMASFAMIRFLDENFIFSLSFKAYKCPTKKK
jgi:hypothetical protein